jgi:hypothetical protein
MSRNNPTALRLGQTGLIDGLKFVVLGRVVYAMEEGGNTYYWNEYLLGHPSGETRTLVYEEVDGEAQWRLFEQIRPLRPLTAEMAARQRLGDRVEIGDFSGTVDLRGVSKVWQTEGDVPADTKFGRTDSYFNASSGHGLLVVSWRGELVEHYLGRNLPRGFAEQAFGLPPPRARAAPRSGFDWSRIDWTWVGSAAVIAALVVPYLDFSPRIDHPEPAGVKAAPPEVIAVGRELNLEGRDYVVTSRLLTEIREPGRIHRRHEYLLKTKADGTEVQLVWTAWPALGSSSPLRVTTSV